MFEPEVTQASLCSFGVLISELKDLTFTPTRGTYYLIQGLHPVLNVNIFTQIKS